MALWNQRMFLLTGDARYVDVMERAMYNGILSGVSLDGRSFFYSNPLESDGKFGFNQGQPGRAPFFGTACCPGNISRFLPSMPGYIYAVKGDGLYVNLFVQGEAEVEAAGRKFRVKQETRYPWDGAVRITIEPEKKTALSVLVRIPGWARGEAVPGGLYRFADMAVEKPALEVNGKAVAVVLDKGFARIRREWKKGDVIGLRLPMPVRRVVADEAVKDDAGKVALERGPLVYCAEWPDNGGRALNLVLPDGRPLAADFRPDLFNGAAVITGVALVLVKGPAGDTTAKEQTFLAIPYYAWAHRGPGEMAVWLPRK